MTRIGVLAVLLLGIVASVAAVDPEEEEKHPTSFWMRKKLEYSQHILEGLANEDFAIIRRNAEAMQRLSRIEGFVRRTNVENYRTQLKVFEFANAELIRLAGDNNIDGAALAFTQLTLSCVNCHKLIRAPAQAP